jgi:hypothetical protein
MTPEEYDAYRIRRWLDRHKILAHLIALAVAAAAGIALTLAIGFITGDFPTAHNHGNKS